MLELLSKDESFVKPENLSNFYNGTRSNIHELHFEKMAAVRRKGSGSRFETMNEKLITHR